MILVFFFVLIVKVDAVFLTQFDGTMSGYSLLPRETPLLLQ